MSESKKSQVVIKSLLDFIDAGLSFSSTDIEKLYMLTAIALHLEKRQKELRGEITIEEKKTMSDNKKRNKEKKKSVNKHQSNSI